ncbi:anthranilate synthase component II [Gammaproteobacteria bacterium]|nr:anthranilate synthase component II [Gammaproteobacteria bacterium]
MILVIDNYDSFTFNLVQALGTIRTDLLVRRNDAVTIEEIGVLRPDGILLSPGPGRPEDAGITIDVIRQCGASFPVFGVCLGHQAIGAAFGGSVIHAPTLMHGRTSLVHHHGTPLYKKVSDPFDATRYHSLVVERSSLPGVLEITAETADGVIMGVRHRSLRVEGVQFHPESILTTEGMQILRNWVEGLS